MARRLIRNQLEFFLAVTFDVLSAKSPHFAAASILQFAIHNRA